MPVLNQSGAISDFRLFTSGNQYTISISTGYYYTVGTVQDSWSTSNPTQVLNDGSLGDTNTDVSDDYFYDGVHSTSTIAITAFYDAGSSKQLTGWQMTTTCSANYQWILEGSNDSTSWTTLGTGSITTTGSAVTTKYSTYNWSTFRYYRLSVYLTGEYNRLSLSDWRLTLNNAPASDATLTASYLGGGTAQLSWTP